MANVNKADESLKKEGVTRELTSDKLPPIRSAAGSNEVLLSKVLRTKKIDLHFEKQLCITLQYVFRVFNRHQRLENSLATTQNDSPTKFHMFPEGALPFHNNPPVPLQYSPAATPIL